jgi:hypothetical protein
MVAAIVNLSGIIFILICFPPHFFFQPQSLGVFEIFLFYFGKEQLAAIFA